MLSFFISLEICHLVKSLPFKGFATQSGLFTTVRKETVGNTLAKEENAGNQHFLLFPKYFAPYPKHYISIFESLTPLAVGQRAYVMVRCPSYVRPCINFFFKHLLL